MMLVELMVDNTDYVLDQLLFHGSAWIITCIGALHHSAITTSPLQTLMSYVSSYE